MSRSFASYFHYTLIHFIGERFKGLNFSHIVPFNITPFIPPNNFHHLEILFASLTICTRTAVSADSTGGISSPAMNCSPSSYDYFAASAASIAAVTSGESGVTLELKRLMIFPSLLMRNLLKFQVMSPGNGEVAPASAT
jgi:hypothetical protein